MVACEPCQIVEYFIGQAVRPGADRHPDDLRTRERLFVAGAQHFQFAVGVGVALKIRDVVLRARVAPLQKTEPGVDLFGDALAWIEVARRKAGVVAKGTTTGADPAIAVRASEAGNDRYLLDPLPMAVFHLVVPGMVAACAEGIGGFWIHKRQPWYRL